MRVLLTGARGLLGHGLCPVLMSRGADVVAMDHDELDITDSVAVERALEAERPDALVNCAAYTAVDSAEAEPELAMRVNGGGAAALARAAAATGTILVHYSTDFVFDGRRSAPYQPHDDPHPLSAYGRSKLEGEREIAASGAEYLLIRTSWLYGDGGTNFVAAILSKAREGGPLRVVDDQIGRPTWTEGLAATTLDLLKSGARGVWHVTGGGQETTWCGFARAILGACGIEVPVSGISSDEWGAPARRPRYSVLDLSTTESFLGRTLDSWQDDLQRYLKPKVA